jgi:hypothetical protein
VWRGGAWWWWLRRWPAFSLSLSLFSLSHQFPLTSSSTPGVAPPSLSPSARVRTTGWRRSGAGVVCRVVGTFVEEEWGVGGRQFLCVCFEGDARACKGGRFPARSTTRTGVCENQSRHMGKMQRIRGPPRRRSPRSSPARSPLAGPVVGSQSPAPLPRLARLSRRRRPPPDSSLLRPPRLPCHGEAPHCRRTPRWRRGR